MGTFHLDIHTTLILLVTGNLTVTAMMLLYRISGSDRKTYLLFMLSRILQATGWILLSLRTAIPDFWSIQIGNTILFAGFSLESYEISSFLLPSFKLNLYQAIITTLSILSFWLFSNSGTNIRVGIASLVTFCFYLPLIPSILFAPRKSRLSIIIGLLYMIFLITLVLRAWQGFTSSSQYGLWSQTLIQTLTFLPLHIILLAGSFGFLLMLKEKDDLSLRESEQKFSTAFLASPYAIILSKLDTGEIMEASPTFFINTGFNRKEVIGKSSIELNLWDHPEDRASIISTLMSQGQVLNREIFFKRKNGEAFPALFSAARLTINEKNALLSIIHDITERKTMEEGIRKLLTEKEILLKEVHHRVKNNMVSMISLLNLQANTQKNQAVTDALSEAGNRIRSMMVLYDQLYRSEEVNTIDLSEYISSLISHVRVTYPGADKIHFQSNLEHVVLPVKLMATIGIIINELITNSLKYAFPDFSSGVINLDISLADGLLTIHYQDNGCGFIPDKTKAEGFGMDLISMLAHQLHSEMTVKSSPDHGTSYLLEKIPLS